MQRECQTFFNAKHIPSYQCENWQQPIEERIKCALERLTPLSGLISGFAQVECRE